MIPQEKVREAIKYIKTLQGNEGEIYPRVMKTTLEILTLYSEGKLVPKYTEEELDEILPKKSSHMICGTTYHTDKDAGFNEAIDICKKALLKERG